jgi:tartrate dehydrogenase/decarboxylase/D-malate dehydrogenase
MKTYRIALYPGDGIGLEVGVEVVKVLRVIEQRFGFKLDMHEFDWASRYWKRTGKVVPDDFLEQLKPFDAIWEGAIGDPLNVPDHITLVPLIQIRQQFDLYACVRPAKLLPGVTGPLRESVRDIDMVVIRENSEGEYVNAGGWLHYGHPDEAAMQSGVHSRRGIERIVRYAFSLAQRRRKHLSLATKSNALKYGYVLWDKVFLEIAKEFPDVEADKFHIDAITMHFVNCPQRFDVVVASNLFGDILTDLGGAISGSIGLAPSANINPERNFPSLFEPVHGSAPDIVGKGIANPIAGIRAAAMMLDFLGEAEAANAIEEAVCANLAEGRIRTPDLGGKSSTIELADDIVRRIL